MCVGTSEQVAVSGMDADLDLRCGSLQLAVATRVVGVTVGIEQKVQVRPIQAELTKRRREISDRFVIPTSRQSGGLARMPKNHPRRCSVVVAWLNPDARSAENPGLFKRVPASACMLALGNNIRSFCLSIPV